MTSYTFTFGVNILTSKKSARTCPYTKLFWSRASNPIHKTLLASIHPIQSVLPRLALRCYIRLWHVIWAQHSLWIKWPNAVQIPSKIIIFWGKSSFSTETKYLEYFQTFQWPYFPFQWILLKHSGLPGRGLRLAWTEKVFIQMKTRFFLLLKMSELVNTHT